MTKLKRREKEGPYVLCVNSQKPKRMNYPKIFNLKTAQKINWSKIKDRSCMGHDIYSNHNGATHPFSLAKMIRIYCMKELCSQLTVLVFILFLWIFYTTEHFAAVTVFAEGGPQTAPRNCCTVPFFFNNKSCFRSTWLSCRERRLRDKSKWRRRRRRGP